MCTVLVVFAFPLNRGQQICSPRSKVLPFRAAFILENYSIQASKQKLQKFVSSRHYHINLAIRQGFQLSRMIANK